MILRTNTCNIARFKPSFAHDNKHEKIYQIIWLYLIYFLFDLYSLKMKLLEEIRF